jgi:hypothetical protein
MLVGEINMAIRLCVSPKSTFMYQSVMPAA